MSSVSSRRGGAGAEAGVGSDHAAAHLAGALSRTQPVRVDTLEGSHDSFLCGDSPEMGSLPPTAVLQLGTHEVPS